MNFTSSGQEMEAIMAPAAAATADLSCHTTHRPLR